MTFPQPTVIEDASTSAFIHYVLDQHDLPSVIIVCGAKDEFLQRLSEEAFSPSTTAERPARSPPASLPKAPHWDVPTLRLLSKSRTVKLVFCPDITHLRAYLATYSTAGEYSDVKSANRRLLAVMNLVQLHRPTSAFSAQGFNRTFSVAVEAAHRSNSKLVISECDNPSSPTGEFEQEGVVEAEVEAEVEEEATLSRSSVWDEEMSILNVTTKRFGVGERGWVGRTVKLRNVAARWCVFRKLE